MATKLRDIDIRYALDSRIRSRLGDDALIRHEFTVGARRMDVAALTAERFLGWEIKSDVDTLDRLDGQAVGYGFVFDFVTLVTTPKYAQKSMPLIPDWWEVVTCEDDGTGQLVFSGVRPGGINTDVTEFGLAELLWREEAFALLRKHDLARGLSGKPRRYLWEHLAAHLDVPTLRQEVLTILRARTDWTGGAMPGQQPVQRRRRRRR